MDPIRINTEIHNSKEFSLSLLNNFPFPIIVINPDSSIRYINQALEELTGFSYEELIGIKAPYPWWTKDRTQKIRRNLERAMVRGAHKLEERFRRKNGEPFWVEITATPIKSNGKLKYYLANWVNVTDRKRTEGEIKKRQTYLEAVLHNAPNAIVTLNASHCIMEWNPGAEEIFGYTNEEVINKNLDDLITNSDVVAESKALTKKILSGKKVSPFETIRYRKNGTPINVIAVGSPIIAEGKLYGVVAVYRDITQQKRAEATLIKQSIRDKMILQNAIDGFHITDIDGNILEANHATSIIFGYSYEEIVGMNICDLDVNDAARESEKHIRNAMKDGSKRFEIRQRRKDRQIIDLEVSMNFVKINGERFFFSFFHDITKRKQVEKELLAREEELEIKSSNCEELNTVLKVLLKKRDEDKIELEEKVLSNINELIFPYIEKMKKSGLDERQKVYLDVLETNINDIISPFSHRLSSSYLRLSPAEMQVANLVRQGKSTKEIADFLNLSCETIDSHRRNIRKKIGINNKKANLRTCLLCIQ